MTRTKQDILRTIALILERPVDNVELITEGIYSVIASYLIQGDRIEIRGLGTFEPYEKAGRTVRNVHKNEPMSVLPRPGIRFRPSKLLEKEFQDYAHNPGLPLDCSYKGHHSGQRTTAEILQREGVE